MTEVAFTDASGNVRLRGTLEPPPGGATPTLAEVLAAGNDGGGADIVNVTTLDLVGGISAVLGVFTVDATTGFLTLSAGVDLKGYDLDLHGGNLLRVQALALDGANFGRAAHVANGSTVDQLRDALIAAGLMAAS